MSTTQKEMEKAVIIFNAMNDRDLIAAEGFSFLNCLDMAKKSTRLLPETPSIHADSGEDLLNAVGRAFAMKKSVDLFFGDHIIHISPSMTLAEAFSHAQYVIELAEFGENVTGPTIKVLVESNHLIRPPAHISLSGIVRKPAPEEGLVDNTMQSTYVKDLKKEEFKDIRQSIEVDLDMFAEQAAQALRDAAFDELEKQRRSGFKIPELESGPEVNLPPYTPLTSGFIHQPEYGETIEQTVTRLSARAPVRVRLCGLVMTIREDITISEMVNEAHRLIKAGISDAPVGPEKRLPIDEEMLDDGTLRTSTRVWRHGYQYRLDVLPFDRTEMAEYHIHLKSRPTQTWMDNHLPLMYEKKAKMFLNITNGVDHFENVLYLYCTAAGRASRDLELAKIEKQMADEFAERGNPNFKPSSMVATPKKNHESDVISASPAKPEPTGTTDNWEDSDSPYRVRYYDSGKKAWCYSYFTAKPTAIALKLRDSTEGKATFQVKGGIPAWGGVSGAAGHAKTDDDLNPIYSK